MKLSFVIPAYNEERLIGSCLESVFKDASGKDYDIEIIVVNNASTDKTKDIASAFAGVKVVDEPKKGLVAARQAGYLASSGELIANIDADTKLTPGWISRVLQEFEADENLVTLSGPFIYYDLPTRKRIGVRLYYYYAFLVYLFNKHVWHISSLVQGGNFVVRRTALDKIGGFNPNFDFYGEDADIAYRMNKVGNVKFTFKLPIYSSGRRLEGEGMLKTGLVYVINFVWTIFFKKPFTKKETDIRK